MQIRTPEWVKHAVFYQIFPDRFAKGKVPSGTVTSRSLESWEAMPTLQGYKGGNLWGVIEKLDYLQNLGINAIYFTPIFQSACNHRYHTHDYYQIDPLLGGNAAFEQLLTAAHQRQIKIVLDGVFNHASRGFFFFNDILENGPHSPWVDWFKIEDWPLCPYDGDRPANYVSWAGNRALPEFNHDNPDVREYIMRVGEYWIAQGIDGWRLDVPNCVKTPGFWQEFRDRVKAINPEAYIVGEIWDDASEWLDGTQFDGVMNYRFTEANVAFTAGDRVQIEYVRHHSSFQPYPALDAAGYAAKIEHLLALYPWEIQLTQLNLLDSHDTARLLAIAGGEKEDSLEEARSSVKLATLLLFTFPGAPSVYYGDEVGLAGGIDPDCRRAFPPEAEWHGVTLDYHYQLIKLRHTYPALRIGKYRTLFAEGGVYAFARQLGNEVAIVAVNVSTEPKQISCEVKLEGNPQLPERIVYGVGITFSWQNRDGSEEFTAIAPILSLLVPARSGLVLA
ncbi:glycoside hydrolase family 13 protein [Pseudanabaena sp. PCC 6802]|uniref:glycoside hydrolase family 13 protein n=1 Tax=Pseudanabaena sp. PCC 6802 TaxID=118173 RepID=UPI000345EF65|nr:glycoside hydrolase family 13 protein [Pseudanabaena sp. PCC 6802]